jgi:3-oxoacyl-[acyl-carrier-protein] synthase II
VSPSGIGADAFWQSCLQARTGTRALEFAWLEGRQHRSRVGAPVGDIDLSPWGYRDADLPWLDRVSQYALAATAEALRGAGLTTRRRDDKSTAFDVEGVNPQRVATVIGSGMGGLSSLEAGHEVYQRTGGASGGKWTRYSLPRCIPNAPAAQVAIRHGFHGECKSLSTACAAGTMAVGDACRLVWQDQADVVVAGGAEALLSDHDGLGLMAFDALRCLSTSQPDVTRASRPFDRARDGFVLGEGAGILVIESADHARARGATILAEVLAYESGCSAFSMVQPDPSGEVTTMLMARALRSAGLEPADLGLVSAHATSTPAGDLVEAKAIRTALDGSVDDVLVTATKGVTGHAIAASGPLEIIASVLAMRDDLAPPTANLDDVDDGCELRHVRGAPQPLPRRAVLKSTHGFGGHDAAMVLARR